MPPQTHFLETSGENPGNVDNLENNAFSNPAFVPEINCLNSNEKNKKKSEKEGSCDVEEKPFDFDDLLPHVGEFGLYQKILFLLMIPFAFSVAFVYFTQLFLTLTPDEHWCWVPELANLTQEQRKLLSIPLDGESFDKCKMYNVDYNKVLSQGIIKADPSWPVIPCQKGWEYDFSTVPYASIATEQNWVCKNAALPNTAQSIFFCGAIVGGLLFGWIADRIGRLPALLGTNLVGFIAGVATASFNSFVAFSVCRFFVGMAFDNCFTMMYILVLEYVGPKWRTFVANMSIAIFFTVASSGLPYIAYFVADWRMLCYVTSIPMLIAILTAYFIPESARWLCSQGKFDKAISIMKKFEKINGTKVDPIMYDKFRASCEKALKEEELSQSYTVLDLFKTPRLRRITIVLIILWMSISLVFDGHVRNVGSLGLDVFLTFCIACALEFPADGLLTMVLDVWGRRWLSCGTMVVSGIFSILATTVPIGIPSATLALIGRFAINITYSIGLQYAAELLPTVVRAQGVALIHIMGYVASILAPFIVYLANISPAIPLIILGILGIAGGILALFLPETLGHELPQTLQDGEEFGLGQKIWDMPCLQSPDVEKAPKEETFKRSPSVRNSIRASVRGEARSNILNRSSRSLKPVQES